MGLNHDGFFHWSLGVSITRQYLVTKDYVWKKLSRFYIAEILLYKKCFCCDKIDAHVLNNNFDLAVYSLFSLVGFNVDFNTIRLYMYSQRQKKNATFSVAVFECFSNLKPNNHYSLPY